MSQEPSNSNAPSLGIVALFPCRMDHPPADSGNGQGTGGHEVDGASWRALEKRRPDAHPEGQGPYWIPKIGKVASDERTDRGRVHPPQVLDVLWTHRWYRQLDRDGPSIKLDGADWSVACLELWRFVDESWRHDVGRTEPMGPWRREPPDALCVLHLEPQEALDGEALQRYIKSITHLTTRARQARISSTVNKLISPFAKIRVEETNDLADTSEMPLVVAFELSDQLSDDPDRAAQLLTRSTDGLPDAQIVRARGWGAVVYPDAVGLVAATATHGYRPYNRQPWAVRSFLVDALAMRFAERLTQQALARRIGTDVERDLRDAQRLHKAALRSRARLSWPSVSLEPWVAETVEAWSSTWMLKEVTREVYAELEVSADEAIQTLLTNLTQLLAFLAVITIVMGALTAVAEDVGLSLIWISVVLLLLALAAVIKVRGIGSTLRLRRSRRSEEE